MYSIRQALCVCSYNFRMWHKNPRIIVTFALSFILCFLLSSRAIEFSFEMGTIMQLAEAFIWTFGDANNILFSSLLLLLLFADMPFICDGTPLYLMRTTRKTWLGGQILYVCIATLIYISFILLSTSLLCAHNSFIGNIWSETAAMLGYSGTGYEIALPAFVKTMEMSSPYECMGHIFLLMLLYTLFMVSLMLTVNIKKGQFWGIISAFLFSLFGFLLNPKVFGSLFNLSEQMMYKANVAVGWMSPLNHATYHMHNFGYDLLPTLWQTYIIFIAGIVILFIFALKSMRKYNFNFTGSSS